MTKKAKATAEASSTAPDATATGTDQDAQGAAQTTEGGQTPTEDVKTDPTASGADQSAEGSATESDQDDKADPDFVPTPKDGEPDPAEDSKVEHDEGSTSDEVKNPTDLTTDELNVLNHVADQLAQTEEEQKAEPYAYEGAAPATPYEAVPSHEHHLLNLVDATLGFPPEEAYEQLKVMDITEWSKPCRDYHAAILQYVDEQE